MAPITRRALLRTGLGAAGLLAGVPILDNDSFARPSRLESDTTEGERHSMDVTVRQTAPDARWLAEASPHHGVGRLLAVQQSDLERSGLVVGQQIRLHRVPEGLASFTVVGVPDRAPAGIVWIDETGLERLAGTDQRSDSGVTDQRSDSGVTDQRSDSGVTDQRGDDGTVEARLETPVPEGTLSTIEAREAGEYVEAVLGDGGKVAVIAPHGGAIEAGTARQAARTVEVLPEATAWLGRGFRPGGGAFERWHVTSTALHPASYPGLASLATREYDHAVGFHGFADSGVLVGGGATLALRRRLRDALADALPPEVSVRLAPEGPYDGNDPENPANWLTRDGAGGVQLEQGWDVRADHGETVAETVAAVLEGS